MNLNRIVIVGGGSSIRQGLWTTPVKDLELWKKLDTQYTIGINFLYQFYTPSFLSFCDYDFYLNNKKDLDKLPLIVGRYDTQLKRQLSKWEDNLILLKSTGQYFGHNSWTHGFYSGVLTGVFVISVAICLGFKEIYLLGYDYTHLDSHTHFYQDEVDLKETKGKGVLKYRGVGTKIKNGKLQCICQYYNGDPALKFDAFKSEMLNVKIVNVCPQSKIATFPKIDYPEFYEIIKNDEIKNQTEFRDYVTNTVLAKRANNAK